MKIGNRVEWHLKHYESSAMVDFKPMATANHMLCVIYYEDLHDHAIIWWYDNTFWYDDEIIISWCNGIIWVWFMIS